MSVNEYRILLLGSSGVGKSTYVNKLITGNFETELQMQFIYRKLILKQLVGILNLIF